MLEKREREELKSLIEEEEACLDFFALYGDEFKDYGDEFKEFESEKEWVEAVNECLDNLIPLYRRLKEENK